MRWSRAPQFPGHLPNAILAALSRPVSIFTAAHEAHELATAAQEPLAFLFIGIFMQNLLILGALLLGYGLCALTAIGGPVSLATDGAASG